MTTTDTTPPRYAGVWLPLVTPFKGGQVDEASIRRLVAAYTDRVDGFVLCATTGEALALSEHETRRVADCAREALDAAGSSARTMLGLCGASTAGVVRAVRDVEGWPVDALLVTCPYYVRPSQEGLHRHFQAIGQATDRDLLVYNIPYRTGVNLQNDTLLALVDAHPNVLGVKDCCADADQTRDLIARKPRRFAVLTGDDACYAQALTDGADGGVLASAHLDPEGFRSLLALARAGRRDDIAAAWADLAWIPDLLFAEPNPAALKHALWRLGHVANPELRLPMTPPTAGLAQRIDKALGVT